MGKKHSSTPSFLDLKRGEIVDFFNGEVDQDHIAVFQPIRAENYAEWDRKRHHSPLLEEKEKKMWLSAWTTGEKIGAPKWLREEVFWFLKKAKALKAHPVFRGKAIYTHKEKYILAVYYVIACRRGLHGVAERIALMPCSETGEPCYVSRKKGNKEFKKYLKYVLRYASFLCPANKDPVTLLDEFVAQQKVVMPEIVYKRAREIALKASSVSSGRKPQNVVAAAIKIAIDEIMPSNKAVYKQICKAIGANESSVKPLIKKLKNLESST